MAAGILESSAFEKLSSTISPRAAPEADTITFLALLRVSSDTVTAPSLFFASITSLDPPSTWGDPGNSDAQWPSVPVPNRTRSNCPSSTTRLDW
eukprot:CAMPEP_0171606120 /NCGR_PEP_ID=MMETSP0990-20121206/7580_1 /TAXON_ID=483369 /ORGANISM="non described non described, Strain CCMP2098" /LENGTH=93 /DNA_ID=CAMNT_0012168909 /DNA_START=185 /DNA_END=463 /DNA_ORIENTATION=+